MPDRTLALTSHLPGLALAARWLAPVSLHAQCAVTYRLSMPEPWTHLYGVVVDISELPAGKGAIEKEPIRFRASSYEVLADSPLEIGTQRFQRLCGGSRSG